MIRSLISKNWFFSEDNKNYSKIDLPHDYQVTKTRSPEYGGESNAYYPDERGFYIKHLNLDKKKHYTLHVDGAYMCAQILLNENHIALHPHGYAPFLCDLTPYMIADCTNKLKIITSPIANSSRWYSGNGIYRDVFIWEGGDIRIEPWDMFVFTKEIGKDSATVCARFDVTSDKKREARVHLCFIAPDGTVIPCQSWLSSDGALGNILEDSFKDVWEREGCRRLRNMSEEEAKCCPFRKRGENE